MERTSEAERTGPEIPERAVAVKPLDAFVTISGVERKTGRAGSGFDFERKLKHYP